MQDRGARCHTASVSSLGRLERFAGRFLQSCTEAGPPAGACHNTMTVATSLTAQHCDFVKIFLPAHGQRLASPITEFCWRWWRSCRTAAEQQLVEAVPPTKIGFAVTALHSLSRGRAQSASCADHLCNPRCTRSITILRVRLAGSAVGFALKTRPTIVSNVRFTRS